MDFTTEYTEIHREKHKKISLNLYSVCSIFFCVLGGKGCVQTAQ